MLGQAVKRTLPSIYRMIRVQNRATWCETSCDFKVTLDVGDEDYRSTVFVLMWFQHQRILGLDNESKAGTMFVLGEKRVKYLIIFFKHR